VLGRVTTSVRWRCARLLTGPSRLARGFGILEWLVIVAVLGLLTAVGLPSMRGFLERRAVEGVAQQLVADLQYARSEAVQRNEAVSVTAGVDCVVSHLASATAECTSTSAAVTPADGELKSVRLGDSGGTLQDITLRPLDDLAQVRFEPVGGTAAFVGPAAGAGSASWQVTDGAGQLRLRVDVNLGGRVSLCVPSGSSFPGHAGCP
jgi:type IV fimbrial biogenesis protein FimT